MLTNKKIKAFNIRKLFFIAAFLFYACLLGYSVLEEAFTNEFTFGESKVEALGAVQSFSETFYAMVTPVFDNSGF